MRRAEAYFLVRGIRGGKKRGEGRPETHRPGGGEKKSGKRGRMEGRKEDRNSSKIRRQQGPNETHG